MKEQLSMNNEANLMGGSAPLVIYDGSCGFCNRTVLFIIRRNKDRTIRFSANRSKFGKEQLEKHGLEEISEETLVFIESGIAYTYSDAAIRIARHLEFPWSILRIFAYIPKKVRNPVYRVIAKNRHRIMGRSDIEVAQDKSIRKRFIEGTE